MFKLILITGPKPRKTFDLPDGTYVIGRSPECDIHLASSVISKQQAALIVSGDYITIEDLNSRNGTFVNGVMVRKAEIKAGDRISFQDIILEIGKTKPSRQKAPFRTIPPVQAAAEHPALFKKVFQLWHPLLAKASETVEWKYITLTLLLTFVLIGFGAVVPPLLNETKVKLRSEALRRGEFIVKSIARENQKHLSLQDTRLIFDHLKLSTALARSEERVLTVNIVDPRTKKILAPSERLNKNVDSRGPILRGAEAEKLTYEKISANNVLISQPIFLFSETENRPVVGAVVQAIFNIEGIGLTDEEYMAVLARSLLILLLIGAAFYLMLHQVTAAAFSKINQEIEAAARRGYRHLEIRTKFEEVSNIVGAINKVFKRTRDMVSQLPEENRMASEKAVEDTDEILKNLILALPDGVAVLNERYQIIKVNPAFQTMAGISRDVSSEQSILDVIQDQELLRNLSHGLGEAARGATIKEDLHINQQNAQLTISAIKNPDDEIEYYILNLRAGV